MESFGPQYCETFIGGGVFPIELVNTLTSLIPAFFGVALVAWLVSRGRRDLDVYALALLLLCTGVGSALWHGFRSPMALALDVMPGMMYFLVLLYVWPSVLKGKWYAYGSLVLFVILEAFISIVFRLFFPDARAWPLFFVAAVMGAVLTLWTHQKDKKAGVIAFWMMASAIGAAFARTYDLAACSTLPIGTHFVWHMLLGVAGFLGVMLVYRLKGSMRAQN